MEEEEEDSAVVIPTINLCKMTPEIIEDDLKTGITDGL